MKSITVHLLLLLFSMGNLSASKTSVPFDPVPPQWLSEIVKAKPISLEICHGESNEPLPVAPSEIAQGPNGSPTLLPTMTPWFHVQSQRHLTTLSLHDSGYLIGPQRFRIAFKIAPTADSALHLIMKITVHHPSGSSAFDENLNLKLGQWMVRRLPNPSEGRFYYLAYRLIPPPNDL